MSRAVHCSSGVLLVLAALLLCGGGPASAATAPPARWTEAKAETRIEHGTYRVVDKGEVFWANNGVLSLRPTLAQARAQGGPQRVIDLLAAQLAAAEVKLAQAEAGRALTLASCKGTYGRKLGPANGFGSYRIPTYTRFRCEATVVGRTWKTGAAMVYAFSLRPGGWNGRRTAHGFRVLGLRLMPAA